MKQYGGVMMHGALIEREDKGYIFTAISGTGKTTHIMNWLKIYDDVSVVNGDKPILRLKDDGIYGYGTPWCGKEKQNTNKSVKLENLIILERGKENHIERVSYMEYFNKILKQLYIPNESEEMKQILEMIKQMSKKVKIYKLSCNMEPDSARVAYEGMNK